MLKSALIESRKLLDFAIENIEDLSPEQIESVKHFLSALIVGCLCDDYNGFDCGCRHRSLLYSEAMKELEDNTFN